MDDSWSFRTERGRAWVADGVLRVDGSALGWLRSAYRQKWSRTGVAEKVLFLFSLAGMAMWLERVIPALRALVGPGSVSSLQWFVLGSTALIVLVTTVQAVGHSERVPLRRVEAVRRADRTFTVEYAEDDEEQSLEIDARTGDDADSAAEILRLKGVPVENRGEDADGDEDDHSDDDASVSYDILGRQS